MKLKIPFRFRLAIPILGWSVICFLFNIVIALNTVAFDPNSEKVFLIISATYFAIVFIFTILATIPVRFFETDVAKVLSKNIKNGKLVPNISIEEVTKVSRILCDYPKRCLKNTFLMGIGYLLIILIWQLIFFASQFNFFALAMISTIAISLMMGFSLFWTQFQSFGLIRQCRDVLATEDLKLAEVYSSSIRTKLFFVFFYLLDVAMLYILASLCEHAVGTVIFLSGIVMIIFLSSILLLYLDNSLKGFMDSVQKVSKKELTIFSTGSLDKEFVDLSKNLNEISTELYTSKQEAVSAKKEMEKRVKELERFFEATISREEKMIELKKENEELRNKLAKRKK